MLTHDETSHSQGSIAEFDACSMTLSSSLFFVEAQLDNVVHYCKSLRHNLLNLQFSSFPKTLYTVFASASLGVANPNLQECFVTGLANEVLRMISPPAICKHLYMCVIIKFSWISM